jgi:ABC-type multidrug transport system ATPase subunit
MTESVLKSIMRLFAIIGNIRHDDEFESNDAEYAYVREVAEAFLGQLVNPEQSSKYLQMFDFHYRNLQRRRIKINLKRVALFSVKTLLICEQINNRLNLSQKSFVLLQLFDILKKNTVVSESAIDFIHTISDTFGITSQDFDLIYHFVFAEQILDEYKNYFMVVSGQKDEPGFIHHLYRENMDGVLLIFYLPAIKTYFFRHKDSDDWLYINGRSVLFNRIYLLEKGTTIRCPKIVTIHHSDILGNFLHTKVANEINLSVQNIEFNFKNSDNGIKKFSFDAKGGQLIGVMGGSGVGKSTFLSLLNGSLKPTAGNIYINGIDIYSDNEKINGVIGYIPQDDFLVEELSVFDNLYFNARFCFDNYSEEETIQAVDKLLKDLDLYDIRDLKVGSPLNKFISGGQRKRLNIALELLREPYILFVDEPTSGLSSNDSEKVVELLKQQTYRGKLVIVNIHQPSSDIFKMFDNLLVMDKGGRVVYYGNAIDSLVYFKTATQHVNANESECIWCGNLNPEMVLQIIETVEIDERGQLTGKRMIPPEDWYQLYLNNIESSQQSKPIVKEMPQTGFRIPGKLTQFLLYFLRNIKCKLADKQYLLINALEAPLLAIILSFFTRYSGGPDGTYILSENINIPAYLFMSIVVALFIGMMGSAEEIIRDAKLLKREGFLNLSRWSYINSKVLYLFIVSGIQMIMYVIISHAILEIHGFTWSSWLMLFSITCFANILGLNLSSGLRSVVAIYIFIPLLLIPQLLLSGIIVKFDKLQNVLKSNVYVPWVGDLMASRWAYEGLSVDQFKNNKYQSQLYDIEYMESNATYCSNYWIPELLNRTGSCELYFEDPAKRYYLEKQLPLIKNEVSDLAQFLQISNYDSEDLITIKSFNKSVAQSLTAYLKHSRNISLKLLNNAQEAKDKKMQQLQKTHRGHNNIVALKERYHNNSLADQVLNKSEADKIIEENQRLYRKYEPVFYAPMSKNGRSHFYAPVKNIGSITIDTFWFNLLAIWFMSIVLYIVLVRNWIYRLIKVLQAEQ